MSQVDSTVTAVAARSIAAGRSSVGQMAALAHCDVITVDMGMQKPVSGAGLLERRIGAGTADITEGPAMTRAQAEQAVLTGAALVRTEQERGCTLLATGEMGIGNTTTSSAVAAVLLGLPVETMTGRGAGLSTDGLNRKIQAIKKAIALHHPDKHDPVDVLAKVGGFDIAAIAGLFLGGAALQMPVVIDGVISATGALAAACLCRLSKDYMLASHVSKEPAGALLLEALGKEAPLHCDMCLGEGTGGLNLFPLLDTGLAVYHGMGDFGKWGMDAYEHLE